MKSWITNVFSRYVNVRNKLHDENARIVLIMNNFGCHSREEAIEMLQHIGSIEVAWLSHRTSHLFQPLGLSPFEESK